MLKWFADRLAQKGEDVRKDERGFTLIELLVVVIIIGILAAIAIPTFLSQRDKADEAAAQSDLRNLAASASAYAADNDGLYNDGTSDMTAAVLKSDYNWNQSDSTKSPSVAVKDVSGTNDGYTATITSANDTTYEFDSETGKVAEQ